MSSLEFTFTFRVTIIISVFSVVYYESLKREVKTKPIKECRCDERLQTRVDESTRLACPRLVAELEYLKMYVLLM